MRRESFWWCLEKWQVHPPPEQLLIFTLVIGRWLAPKRDEQNISDFRQLGLTTLIRNKLVIDNRNYSSKLIAHLAGGADVLELLESFGDENLAASDRAVYSILAIWSLRSE